MEKGNFNCFETFKAASDFRYKVSFSNKMNESKVFLSKRYFDKNCCPNSDCKDAN